MMSGGKLDGDSPRKMRIAMRAAGLPPEMQDAALTVVEQLRRAVGLPDDSGPVA